jgi:hypothetical protein
VRTVGQTSKQVSPLIDRKMTIALRRVCWYIPVDKLPICIFTYYDNQRGSEGDIRHPDST